MFAFAWVPSRVRRIAEIGAPRTEKPLMTRDAGPQRTSIAQGIYSGAGHHKSITLR